MRILVACEESQAVTIELRKLGHEAYSCDIEPCSGGHPEWHLQQDVIPLLNGNCIFQTVDEMKHSICGNWDMIIAFPPCTYMTKAGAVRMRVKGKISRERYQKAMLAKEFFMKIYNTDCSKIAIENPTPMKLIGLPPYDQVIQPYDFGHPYSKRTCLWLKGLPPLFATEIMMFHEPYVNGGCKDAEGNYRKFQGRKERDSKNRAKTFPGVAKAMAEQWAGKSQFYPSYDEIAEGIGRTKSTVCTHTRKLESEGIIIRKADYSPQYRLINMGFIQGGRGGGNEDIGGL